jgi:tRNA G18 (ribose-2'-O)-methylase SpoU
MLRAMVGDHRPHNGVVLDCAPMAGTLPSAVDHLLPALSSRAAAATAAATLNPHLKTRRGSETSASIPGTKRIGSDQSTSATSASGTAAHPTVWVAFDDVQDPQNLGAMLRSCLFFGVSAVIVPAKNSSPPSPTVSKASAGAAPHLPRMFGMLASLY